MGYIPDQNRQDRFYRTECRAGSRICCLSCIFFCFVEKCVIHA